MPKPIPYITKLTTAAKRNSKTAFVKKKKPSIFTTLRCQRCNRKRPKHGIQVCWGCNPLRFEADFPELHSSHGGFDEFIRYRQLNAQKYEHILEWIPFDRLTNIREIGVGGYGTVEQALWKDGPIVAFDEVSNQWRRGGGWIVALKPLRNRTRISVSFLRRLRAAYQCSITKDTYMLRWFGITRRPYSQTYYLVTEYASKGNIGDYTAQSFGDLSWFKIRKILYEIARTLSVMHQVGLLHKNLHRGNVLYDGGHAFVSDPVLCAPEYPVALNGMQQLVTTSRTSQNRYNHYRRRKDPKEVYGVMPYIAPEVLSHNTYYTKAADVYSFGILMWEITTGEPPFMNEPHDPHLALQICQGLRPEIVTTTTPKCIVKLMQRCWHPDPKKRPSTKKLAKTLHNWCNSNGKIQKQFFLAEKKRHALEVVISGSLPRPDPLAIYTSRLIPSVNVGDAKISLPLRPRDWPTTGKFQFKSVERDNDTESEIYDCYLSYA
ncbi:hypothetical protein G9A89_017292 [Geosiphon pyriformis]|nr:hypothetical protein G9A89_017292 [Geosiphon pyriformis]